MAKCKYNADTFPLLAEGYAREGMIDVDIAKRLGISHETFYKYILKYTEFSDALKRGKAPVDVMVENSLLKRAMGFEYTEETEDVNEVGLVRTKTVKKTALPDTTAQIFWLKNRKPSQWRDKIYEEQIDDSLHDIAKAIREGDTE